MDVLHVSPSWIANRAERRRALGELADRPLVVVNAFPAGKRATARAETTVGAIRILLDEGESFGSLEGDSVYGYVKLRKLPLRQWRAFGTKVSDVVLGASVAMQIRRRDNDQETYQRLVNIVRATSPARPSRTR
jgi:hypothetical protein